LRHELGVDGAIREYYTVAATDTPDSLSVAHRDRPATHYRTMIMRFARSTPNSVAAASTLR
jgi:hypothetical protein